MRVEKFGRLVALSFIIALGAGCRASQNASSQSQEVVTDAALPDHVARVIGSLEDFWGDRFAQSHQPFMAPKVQILPRSSWGACGHVVSEPAFYCDKSRTIALEPRSYGARVLRERPNELVKLAFVLAHEYGHAVQYQFDALRAEANGDFFFEEENRAMEAQADFLAGYWLAHAPNVEFEAADTEELQQLMRDIGDGGRGTHPTAEARWEAALRGMRFKGNPIPLRSFALPRE
jgi:predicted metalloprotease